MNLESFDYREPETLAEAISGLEGSGPDPRIKAGGTALIPLMKMGLVRPSEIINVARIPELHFIDFDESEGIRIGAATSLHSVRTSPVVREHYPGLVEAVEAVSALSLHHQSTIGGNVCQDTRCIYYNQSDGWRERRPACFKAGGDLCHAVPGASRCSAAYRGDLAPALIALDASVSITGDAGDREFPLAALFSGRGGKPNVLGAAEIVTHFSIPCRKEGTVCVYEKARIRNSLDYPMAGAAVSVRISPDGTCLVARAVLTALASGPIVVSSDELDIAGDVPDPVKCMRASELAAGKTHPVDNTESSAGHRRKLAAQLVYRGLIRALESRGGEV